MRGRQWRKDMDMTEADSEDDVVVEVITLDDDEDENQRITNDGGNRVPSVTQSSSESSQSSDASESESDESDDEANDGEESGFPVKSKPVTGSDGTEDSSGDSDSEEVDVITLDDDDEKEEEEEPFKPTICCRCPNVTNKVFTDRAMYHFHVKRHRLGECFGCPTCKRPFTQLNFCMAHEIMVHGTEIPLNCYNKNDPVISAAKEFKEKSIRSGKPSGNNDNAHVPSSSGILETDDDALSSGNHNDDKFDINNGHIVASTSFSAYRGPPVTHILECYEIQLNHSRRKDARSNRIAKIAINQHKANVEHGFDEYRLGRFTKRKSRGQLVPSELSTNPTTTDLSSDSEVIKGRRKKRARNCRTSSSSSTTSSSQIAIPPPAPVFAEVKDGSTSVKGLLIEKEKRKGG